VAFSATTALRTVGVAVLCMSQFVDVLSINAAIIALPDIRADLELGAAAGQWVISVYALMFGSLLLFAGRLADRVGHRRLFTVGMVVFVVGSVVCGLAQSGAVLIGARAVTGIAAALTVPAALALLVSGTPESGRPRALGWWTAAGAGGGIAGLALGGVLTDVASWRAAFLLPAALGAACLAFLASLPDTGGRNDAPLDVPGAAAAVAALLLVLTGLSLLGDKVLLPALAALLAAAAFAGLFVVVERRAPSPLLPRGLTRDRPLVAGTVASGVNTAATSPLAVLGAIYLQDVLGWSPAANGLSFVPFSVMVIAGSALGAALLRRAGARVALGAALCALVAMPLVSATITADGGAAVLIAAYALDGLALGVAAVTATALGTSSAAVGDRGFAAGLINTATQLGTAFSIALLVPLAAALAGQDPTPSDTVGGLRVAFVLNAALAAAGGAWVLRRLGGPRRRARPQPR
jgi:MFS family permease